MSYLHDYTNGDLDHHGQRARRTLARRIEAWVAEHLTLSAVLIFISGPLLALPFAVAFWLVLLDGVVVEAEMRAEQRGRDKAVIVTLSEMDKRRLEWREDNGAWRCVAR